LLELPCDVLVPAALENQIMAHNANRVQAPIILELANGPVDSEADIKLAKKNVLVIPDVLANSGGVVGSYLEWVQNLYGYSWKEEEVLNKMKDKLAAALGAVWQAREKQKVTMRVAAFMVALRRLGEAMKGRGVI
ncbi:MAG: Glu/Leu/Phe/Val dehydrogenase, partial [Patescibacteria group bacterium]